MELNINLRKFKNSWTEKRKTASGKEFEVICIPIDQNKLVRGKRDEHGQFPVYMNASTWPLREPDYEKKQTHIIKPKYEKEFYDSLTEAQRKRIPIIGNGLDWSMLRDMPTAPTEAVQPVTEMPAQAAPDVQDDDLPF